MADSILGNIFETNFDMRFGLEDYSKSLFISNSNDNLDSIEV